MTVGVITGDLVASRQMDVRDKEELYAQVNEYMVELKTTHFIQQYELFRGDSLQCIVNDLQQVLRVALMIRAFVKSRISVSQQEIYGKYKGKGKMAVKGYFPAKQDVRLSIGIGAADFRSIHLGHSDGEGFQLSGQGLDEMKKNVSRLAIRIDNKRLNEQFEPSIMLLDAIIEKWTNNQAEIVLHALYGHTEEEIKNKLKITQPAVNQRKKTSQWYAIEKFLSYFEKTIKANY